MIKINQIEEDEKNRESDTIDTKEIDKYIVIQEKCHIGVDLYIGDAVHKVDNVLIGLKAVIKNGELKITSTEEDI